MSDKKVINGGTYTGERAMFQVHDAIINDAIFDDGESPLKHSKNIETNGCLFRWKYPFWYAENIDIKDCTFFEMARAGMWYDKNMTVTDTLIEAPKEFRKCDGLTLKNVSIPNAAETLWNCKNVTMDGVIAKGDYFGMGSENTRIDNFTLYGNYCFDGAKNVEVHNSKFLSKDCFWNAENITIYDSFISGEYLAWNSKNITLINCTIESLQGLCYIDNLVMKNCKLINTTLAFEYSTVDADITSKVDSIINPASGIIRAEHIDTLIMEPENSDMGAVKFEIKDGSQPEIVKETEWTKNGKLLLQSQQSCASSLGEGA